MHLHIHMHTYKHIHINNKVRQREGERERDLNEWVCVTVEAIKSHIYWANQETNNPGKS